MHDSRNRPLELALRFILHTHRSVFLTGRAGTGKTSFLKTIQEQCGKKMAVVAPTGVAAINAGGVTMHTFFQLPLGAYMPAGPIPDAGDQLFNNRASMLRNLRFSQPKRDLLQELELLVIDEVSMVRADLLDAVDAVLRYVRKQPQAAFGGVQVLFIGDLWQLPPVVSEKEWSFLKEQYASPFFFDALVMKEAVPFVIELKKIYRQTDPVFIELLNKVRTNQLDQISWHTLHAQFQPNFQPAQEERYITLSTHNSRADAINQQELNRLPGALFRYEASIEGDFGEKAYPAEELLELRVGAQIMFIKNDKGEFRRYYNGKIGVIEALEEEQIQVGFPGEDLPLLLEKETWKNIRYKLDKAKDKIEEEELGTFSQYPIRLAWAITIHKSQGLTFEKAVVDAGAAFAPGQVYVALSRLTGLEGLVLKTRIPLAAIQTDPRILAFTGSELPETVLEQALETAQNEYIRAYFIQCFHVDGLDTLAADWFQEIEKKTSVSKGAMLEAYRLFQEKVQQVQQVARKTENHFRAQFMEPQQNPAAYLLQRSSDAIQYFDKLFLELTELVEAHAEAMKKEPRLIRYQRELNQLIQAIQVRQKKMQQALPIARKMKEECPAPEISELIQALGKNRLEEPLPNAPAIPKKPVAANSAKEPKKEPGASQKESVDLFKQGYSIQEIASERNLAASTIEGHLLKGIQLGQLDAGLLVTEEVRAEVLAAVEKLGAPLLGPLKEYLGEAISYTQIKAALLASEGKPNLSANSS
ncbi:MAG: hypothetical protein A1D16_04485 [Flavihumibacter sp. CACIAM 22H1]|nr:MAG: hypothetical protein A1D16_04485 [Flavihumibacter sp. CACIAM 22H1]